MQLPEWSSGIGKHLLKIEDGKQAVGNFRGEIVRFYQHWKAGRPTVCQGRETCPLCASANEDDRKATGRFRINFITRTSPPQAMVFEGGKRVYDQLLQLNKDVPLEKAWVRISVSGTKTNKQTMLAIVPGENGLVKPGEEKELLKVELHDLSLNKPEEEGVDEPGSDG
jgi:hypothetical protein